MTPEDLAQQTEQKKSNAPKIVGIVALVFAALGGFVFLVFMLTAGAREVPRAYLEAIAADDLVGAYALTSQDFQGDTSFGEFEDFVEEFSELKEYESSFFNSTEVNGVGDSKQGLVQGTFTTTGGSTVPVEFTLVKEQGEWKIYYFDMSGSRSLRGGVQALQPSISFAKVGREVDENEDVIDVTDIFVGGDDIFIEGFVQNISEGEEVASAIFSPSGEMLVSNSLVATEDWLENSFYFSFTVPDDPEAGEYTLDLFFVDEDTGEIHSTKKIITVE